MPRIVLALCILAGLSVTSSAGPARLQSDRLLNGRLAYSLVDNEDVDGYAILVVSDPNGARRKVILTPEEGSGVFAGPSWSPDGTRLAVTYTVGNRYFGYTSDIYVANPDGTDLHRPVTQPQADRFSPSWSPDGSELAYVQGQNEIWIADANGSNAHRVTTGLDPSWSPDGGRLVFARGSGNNTDLYVIRLDGSGLRRITTGVPRDDTPHWSPGGKLIVFGRGRGEVSSIYTVRPNGTGLRRLTKKRYDGTPSWSPDGRKIVFSGRGDIWIMDRDGRHQVNVTRTKTLLRGEDGPAWQPVHMVDGTIRGTRFDDYLAGSPGNDVISGGDGRDVMIGRAGSDTFLARDGGIDTIDGGPGRDRAFVDPNDRVRRVERVVR